MEPSGAGCQSGRHPGSLPVPGLRAGRDGRFRAGASCWTRGMGVSAGRGTRAFRRAVAVDLVFAAMLAGASLSQGTVLSPCPGPATRCGR